MKIGRDPEAGLGNPKKMTDDRDKQSRRDRGDKGPRKQPGLWIPGEARDQLGGSETDWAAGAQTPGVVRDTGGKPRGRGG